MRRNALFILYGLTLLCFAFFTYLFVDQNLIYLKLFYTGFAVINRGVITIIYFIFIFIFFVFYWIFILFFKNRKLDAKELKLLILATIIITLFSYPAMLSYDIFNYITTSKVLYSYHENPYIVMPIEFKGEPFLSFTHAANKIALYGPFWLLLSGFPYLLGFENFIFILFNFKLISVLFYLGTIYLIWKISKNIFSVAFFALNPLVITETLISGHNDIIMMFLAVSALLFINKKRIILGLILLLLSILIKYATIFLIPVYLYLICYVIRNKNIDKERIFNLSALSMFVIFLLSLFREEIYPWYAIWFLIFISINSQAFKKRFLFLVSVFCFSLLLRYMPFMLWGTHFGITPVVKAGFTFIPSIVVILFYVLSGNLCLKKRFF